MSKSEVHSLHNLMQVEDEELSEMIAADHRKYNLEEKNMLGRTPLHAAIVRGYVSTVEELISRNVNVHATDNEGLGCLHLAAQCNDPRIVEIIQLLLRAKVAINSKDAKGNTPAHYMVMVNNTLGFRELLHNGAVLLQNNEGKVPHQLAVELKDTFPNQQETCFAIMDAFVENVRNIWPKHTTPKYSVAGSRRLDPKMDIESVEEYVDTGYINWALEEKGATILHIVANMNDGQSAMYLLAKGANLYAKDLAGATPVDCSGSRLKVILEQEVRMHQKFIAAIKAGDLETVDLMMKEGITADEILDEDKNTALHYAAKFRQLAIAQRLIEEYGANVNLSNIDFKSPLVVAEEEQSDDNSEVVASIISLFKAEAEKMLLPFYDEIKAARNCYENDVQQIINGGAYDENLDDRGNTILHLWASYGTKIRNIRGTEKNRDFALEKFLKSASKDDDLLKAIDFTKKNVDGDTIADCARKAGNEALAVMIEKLHEESRKTGFVEKRPKLEVPEFRAPSDAVAGVAGSALKPATASHVLLQ